eukprot:660725_1
MQNETIFMTKTFINNHFACMSTSALPCPIEYNSHDTKDPYIQYALNLNNKINNTIQLIKIAVATAETVETVVTVTEGLIRVLIYQYVEMKMNDAEVMAISRTDRVVMTLKQRVGYVDINARYESRSKPFHSNCFKMTTVVLVYSTLLVHNNEFIGYAMHQICHDCFNQQNSE